jgi:hypothetical protein
VSQQPQDRRWEVDLLTDEFGEPLHRQFDEDVQQAMAEAAVILLRLGGAIQSYVIRAEDLQSGMWFPTKAVFKWQSFVPGIRAPRPAAPPAPEPEIELPQEGAPVEEFAEAGVPVEDDDEVDGQWYVRGDQRVLATDAAQQQQLLRDGFKPEPQD